MGMLEDVRAEWKSTCKRRRVVAASPVAAPTSPFRYLGRPESDWIRFKSLQVLGGGLRHTDAEAAVAVHEYSISVLRRFWPNNPKAVLSVQTNLANCYQELARDDEAFRLERSVYVGKLSAYGPLHESTILSGVNLSMTLLNHGQYAEVIQISRDTLHAAKQVLSPTGNAEPVLAAGHLLAKALYLQPTASRADVLKAVALLGDIVQKSRHVLGPEHFRTVYAIESLEEARQKLAAQFPS